jgi:phytoene dehydrogenase-like protein
LRAARSWTTDLVVAATHPRITFLEQVDRAELPPDFVADIERWKTRSGTVKVNLAVDRLPRFTCRPEFDPEIHGGTIVLAESLDDMEGAFQDAAAGRPSAVPFADVCIPSVFDRPWPPGPPHRVDVHPVGAPHLGRQADGPGAGGPRRPGGGPHGGGRPGFTDSILFRQVIGPYQMEHEYGLVGGNIFHGELSASQLFHTRPAPATPTTAPRSAASTRPGRPPTAAAA